MSIREHPGASGSIGEHRGESGSVEKRWGALGSVGERVKRLVAGWLAGCYHQIASSARENLQFGYLLGPLRARTQQHSSSSTAVAAAQQQNFRKSESRKSALSEVSFCFC